MLDEHGPACALIDALPKNTRPHQRVPVWSAKRNRLQAKITWQFTKNIAWVKLGRFMALSIINFTNAVMQNESFIIGGFHGRYVKLKVVILCGGSGTRLKERD